MYATFHIRNNVREHWFDPREWLWCVFTVKRRPSTQLFDLHGCVRMKIFSQKHVSAYNLYNFLCCARPTCFHAVCLLRDVFNVHARVRVLRDGCVHTFLTYEVTSMRNFKHITPCLSHNLPQVHSKHSTTSRLFNFRTLLTMQLLTYNDVSVCKLSHLRTCLFATCHKIV